MVDSSEAVVRTALAAMTRGDVDAALELVDPDLEWTFLEPTEADPEPKTCHGREQLEYALNRNADQFRMEPEEVAVYGPRVLVVTHVPGLDERRERKANDRNFHVVTVADGRIVKLRACRSRDEAVAFATAR